MFTKNFKMKASNNLKSSYRKTLVQKLKATYPTLTEDDLKEMIPMKASLMSVKLTTASDALICVYTADNVPIILEINEIFYPTVYALWKCPNMLPTITIESHLADKLQDGLIHVRRSFLPAFGNRTRHLPHFDKGAVLSVNTEDNEAAVLVGFAQYSSSDILIVQTGVCITTMNIIGDSLCSHEKFVKLKRPQLKPPTCFKSNKTDSEVVTEGISQLAISNDVEESEEIESNVLNNDNINDGGDGNLTLDSTIDNDEFPDDMDGLLRYCLLCVLKVNGKKLELPLSTNLLYANHMTSFCPSDKTLDVKKSSYKKMAKFLEAMQEEGFLQIKEIKKGVDAVTSVNLAHESVRNHYVIYVDNVDTENKTDDSSFKPPSLREVYKITAALVPLFKHQGLKKGQTVTSAEVRSCLTDYVKYNNLQDLNNKCLIKIDPFLGTFTNSSTTISWEEIMSAMLSKMTVCSELHYPDGKTKLLTGQLKHITMQVANRSGNKKVTIVSNLEDYGISLTAMSKECQHGVAASCTITRTPGSKTDQLLVQGNQTFFIAKYLTEVYGLPKKYIEGADKILSKKKK